jgi:catechol 2,3-dioxygenase-like lactoylglutathione lyase family enzyme
MKRELVILPVADVDRSKAFYRDLVVLVRTICGPCGLSADRAASPVGWNASGVPADDGAHLSIEMSTPAGESDRPASGEPSPRENVGEEGDVHEHRGLGQRAAAHV